MLVPTHHELLPVKDVHRTLLGPLPKGLAEVFKQNQAGDLGSHAFLLALQQQRCPLLPVANNYGHLS